MMDSTITPEFENPDNGEDVNKQVEFSANTMDFTQDNFPANNQVNPDGLQILDNPYQVQLSSDSMYNPAESVPYENQDQHNIENIAPQDYFSASDTQYHPSYIAEQPQGSDTVHRNNGITEASTEQYIETVNNQNSIPEVYNDNNAGTDVAQDNIIQQVENADDSSVKIEYKTTSQNEKITENQNQATLEIQYKEIQETQNEEISENQNKEISQSQNGEESTVHQELESPEKNIPSCNQEEPAKLTESDDIKEEEEKEVISNEEVNTNMEKTNVEESNAEQQMDVDSVSEKTLQAEPEEIPQHLTELQSYEAQNVDHANFDDKSEEASTSQIENTQSETSHEEIMEVDDTEEHEDNPEHQEKEEKKQRRTRKPIHEVPMHLFGHDINKPVDPVQNGRALPKPRLGVKVPYRNLTSQIVSKAELEDEVLERSRAKELATNRDDIKFARRLTQKLAKKIAPERGRKIRDRKTQDTIEEVQKEDENYQNKLKTEKDNSKTSQSSSNLAAIDQSKIENNDDLLAILEGEEDDDNIPLVTKNNSDIQAEDSNLKSLEREIALQQLQELPSQEPKERILKPRGGSRCPAMKPEVSKIKSEKSPLSLTRSSVQRSSSPNVSKINSSPKKSSDIGVVTSPAKKPIEIEPQVKVNMVLKTYSRKRKPSDISELEISSPKRTSFEDPDISQETDTLKSDPLALPTDVYVTKSSRVIKKKVIWDPDDEQTIRVSKAFTPKVESDKITPTKVTKLPTPTPEKKHPTPTPEKKPSEKPVEKLKQEQKLVKTPVKTYEKISPPKKVVNKKSPVIKPKRGLSEVDRLLMDEGAVKMLYDLKNDDSNAAKKKKNIYSVERAEKEIIKKANLLKNDLVQNTSNESPKSLRKKEGPPSASPPFKPFPILERKMSKDSTKSSVHTPPRSPDLFTSQGSMLIRRRSSSSISSEDMDEQFTPKLTKSSKKAESSKIKKQKRNTPVLENKKGSKEDEETSTKDEVAKLVKGAQYKAFTIKKLGKHVSIDLNYINDKCYFTNEVLEELTSALKKLEKDKECNVVSLTSTSKAFCLGLDYKSLVADNNNERTKKASDLAHTLRQFLLCLLRFPKVLVAGIQGECVGLGVTMLPLFDSVIASDTATFSTPYANLGCLGEATFLLMYPNLSNNGLAAELLFASQTLKADEACRRGLISKLCWPEKYKETWKIFLSSIANGSRQSLEMTKKQLRANIKEEIEAAIDQEIKILIEHWTSSECQENFLKIQI